MNNNNQSKENQSKLTDEQKQKMKKYAVFTLMFIIFAASMWLIFAPSEDEKAKNAEMSSFNTDIPMPKEEVIIGDKRTAYEQEQMQQRQEEKMRSLQDFGHLLGDNNLKLSGNLATPDDEQSDDGIVNPKPINIPQRQSSIQSSVSAYKDMNRTLGSFYEPPTEDPEKERLKQELNEMKSRIDENDNRKNAADERLKLMEKSFQMAAKYMPGGTFGAADTGKVVSNKKKAVVFPVSQVKENIVSALEQDISNEDLIKSYSQPRNLVFFTATAETGNKTKNTIFACVYSDQTIMDGQSVRLRSLEPMRVGNMVIPSNTVISGLAKIQGERLGIVVNSLEYMGNIVPVELTVYDTDGQQGIFIPNMQELNAAKEVVANMGTSAGTSINLSNDAGEQFAADMGRNVIQGVSQYTSKKLREVKVNLKAGYKIFLLPNDK